MSIAYPLSSVWFSVGQYFLTQLGSGADQLPLSLQNSEELPSIS